MATNSQVRREALELINESDLNARKANMALALFGIGQFLDPEPGSLEADPRFAAFCGRSARMIEDMV